VFFGGYFDTVVLISPTAENDSIQQQLNVNPSLCFSNLRAAPVIIDKLLASQKKEIKLKGSDKAPKIALILDDCMSSQDLMRSSQFLSLFTLGRHANLGIFCAIQSMRSKQNGFPRSALLNCSEIFFFAGSQMEIQVISDNFCPPLADPRLFEKWIFDCTRKPYSFIHLNNKSSSFDNRYRCGLGDILNLDSLRKKDAGRTLLPPNASREHEGETQKNATTRETAAHTGPRTGESGGVRTGTTQLSHGESR
jgi:hypothetical protein